MAGKDIEMNDFAPVTDADYLYGEAADGSQCKLGKANLSIALKPYLGKIYISNIIDCNTLKTENTYAGYRWSNSPVSNISILEVIPYANDWILQRFTCISSNEIWTRTFINGTTWTSWKKVSFTS